LAVPSLARPSIARSLPRVGVLEGSDKLARDAFVHSVKVFTSLVLFYAFIINYNKLDTHYIT